MMNKMLVFGLLIVSLLLIIGCAPAGQEPEVGEAASGAAEVNEFSLTPEEVEVLGDDVGTPVENTGALAGQAIKQNCFVYSSSTGCTAVSGGAKAKVSGMVKTFLNRCAGIQGATMYSCSGDKLQSCRWSCVGTEKCVAAEGKCVAGADVPPPTCTETDGGNVPTVKGTATGTTFALLTETHTDRCVSTPTVERVFESYCSGIRSSDGRIYNYLLTSYVRCPAGMVCRDGACETPCTAVDATACSDGVNCPGNVVVPATGCPTGQSCNAAGACETPCTAVDATACTDGVSCPGSAVVPATGCPIGQSCDASGACVAAAACTEGSVQQVCDGIATVQQTCTGGSWVETLRNATGAIFVCEGSSSVRKNCDTGAVVEESRTDCATQLGYYDEKPKICSMQAWGGFCAADACTEGQIVTACTTAAGSIDSKREYKCVEGVFAFQKSYRAACPEGTTCKTLTTGAQVCK